MSESQSLHSDSAREAAPIARNPFRYTHYALPQRRERAHVEHRWWLPIWAASLLMIFESYLRYAARSDDQAGLQLLPGFWLSDLGLILPIIAVLVSPQGLARPRSVRGLKLYLLATAYGVVWGYVRGNWFSAITVDLRTSLAVVSGLSLMLLVPNKVAQLTAAVVGLLTAAALASSWMVLTSPQIRLLDTIAGVAEPSAFVFAGVTLCLMAPSMILSRLLKRRGLMLLAWGSTGLLLVVSVVFMRTRTLSFTIAFAIFLALLGSQALLVAFKPSIKLTRSLAVALIVLLLGAGVVMTWQADAVQGFLVRVQQIGQLDEDVNWVTRVEELGLAAETMQATDHLVGMGYGVQSFRIDRTGKIVSVLHIAILNTWWRLGVFAFVGVLFLILKLLIGYWRNIRRALSSGRAFSSLKPDHATLTCAAGVLTLVLTSFFSGGWTVSSMLSLGVVWGLYLALTSTELAPPREH